MLCIKGKKRSNTVKVQETKGNENLNEADREKLIDDAFNENYGFLLCWGGMYRGSVPHSIFFVLWTSVQVGFLCYTLYLSRDDLKIFFEAAHFVVFLSNACLGVVNHRILKDNIDFILICIGKSFFDYGNTVDEEIQKEIDEIRKQGKKTKHLLSKAFIVAVFIVGSFLAFARPLYDIIAGNYVNADQSDGIIRTLPIAFWFPIRSDSIWVNIAAALDEYYVTGITAGIVLGADISYLCFSHELCTEFEVLGLTLKKFDQRAIALYKSLYGNRNDTDWKKDPRFDICIKKCLSQSIKHHHLLIEYFNKQRVLEYYLLLAIFLASTFMLCLSGFIFTSEEVTLSSKLTFLLFLSSELTHTFIFCWYGEQIQQLSGEIGDELYRSEWTKYSKCVKNYVLIIQARCTKSLKMSAGGFMGVDIDTYSNVVRTAYSYLSLLRALRE